MGNKASHDAKQVTDVTSVEYGICQCGCGLHTRTARDGTHYSYLHGHHPRARERRKLQGYSDIQTPRTRQETMEEARLRQESWSKAESMRLEKTSYYDFLHNNLIENKLTETADTNSTKENEEDTVLLKGMISSIPTESNALNEFLRIRYVDLLAQYNDIRIKLEKALDAIEFTLRFIQRIEDTDTKAVSVFLGNMNRVVENTRQLSKHIYDLPENKTTVDGREAHQPSAYRDPANERLQELYIDLLEEQAALKLQHEKLLISIEFSIRFIQTAWADDTNVARILVDRLRQVI